MNKDDDNLNTDLPWWFTILSTIALTCSTVGILYIAFGTGRMVY